MKPSSAGASPLRRAGAAVEGRSAETARSCNAGLGAGAAGGSLRSVECPEKAGATRGIAGGECDRGVWISVTGAKGDGTEGMSAESITVATTASIAGGSRTCGVAGRTGVGA